MDNDNTNNQYVISYLTLRKAIGIFGIILPFVLLFFFWVSNNDCRFPPSISHFYYTGIGNYFVGTLCAVSFFLFSYNGYTKQDKWFAKAAGVFALIVALFPTDFGNYTQSTCSRINIAENKLINILHYGAATMLFLTLAFFPCSFSQSLIKKEK